MGTAALAGTFAFNKARPIHRWYGYMEGYSSQLVENELDLLSGEEIRTVYDPFGGAGTTLLSASMRGIVPYYSETNPFMSFVTKVKINRVIELSHSPEKVSFLRFFLKSMQDINPAGGSVAESWEGFEKYYSRQALQQIIHIRTLIFQVEDDAVRDLLMLALSSVLVSASKMVRRGDLRYAKPAEKKTNEPVYDLFARKLEDIITDIQECGHLMAEPVHLLADDCRLAKEENLADCVITSPPYLNGTNYIRNTKLELKLNGFVGREADLPGLHSRGIIAGINNVSKRNHHDMVLPEVSQYVGKLRECAYDKRIPVMVAGYFYDMNEVFSCLKRIMKPNAYFVMDIGDSQFAGVHIPTHSILTSLCENNGFKQYSEEVLRVRHSKNGMKLSQRLQRFRLEK